MKKLVFVFFLLLLCSCGAQKDNGKTVLVFKHGKIAGQSQHLTLLVEQFEKENPSIDIVEQVLPSITDQQRQFYITNLESGASDFDIISLDVIWVPEFARAGWLEDITNNFSEEELSLFLPGPLKADTYQDKLYAVPWYVDGGVLYYRKDLLEKYDLKPPETFNDLENAVRKIQKGENDRELSGFIWQGKQYEGLVCAALEFIEGGCAHVLDDAGNSVINSAKAVNALDYLRSLIDNGIAPEYVTTTAEEATRHSFGIANVIFMRNRLHTYNTFNADDSKIKGKIGVKVMPHFEGCQSASTLGGWQLGINKFSEHKEEAWRFIQFMSRYESQKYLALNVGLKPSRNDVYSDPELIEQQPFIAELHNVLINAVPRPVTPYYPQISLVLQATFSEIISGAKPAKKALDKAQKKLQEILSRSG